MKNRLSLAILLTATALAVGGCFEIDATVRADGSGTMKLNYGLPKKARFDQQKRRLRSPNITIRKAERRKLRAIFDLDFKKVARLNSADFFKEVTIRHFPPKDGKRKFVARVVHRKPTKLAKVVLSQVGRRAQVTLRLPGKIVKSNAKEVKGNVATWKWTTNGFMNRPQVVLTATYEVPAENKATVGTPGATPATGAPSSHPVTTPPATQG